MDYDKYLYYLWLNGINGIGPVTAKSLLNKFKTSQNVYNANLEELLQIQGIGKEIATKITRAKDLTKAKDILELCKSKEINITVIDDEIFPNNIKDYIDVPILLYYKGTLRKDLKGVAIVGARRCTEYAKKVAVEAAEYVAKNGSTVISGMAMGIDSYAHTSCIKADGFTVAVLGCSIDICYPKEHSELMKKIIETGVVISEYPPNTSPKPEYFPKRNRIIAALSSKVLIVEAGEKSGALITAKYAQKYKKEIYVLPGEIYSSAFKGSNKLISEGAQIYLTHRQLLNKELIIDKKAINVSEQSDLEKKVLNLLEDKNLAIDEIANILKINTGSLTEVLFSLEVNSKIRNINGNWLVT